MASGEEPVSDLQKHRPEDLRQLQGSSVAPQYHFIDS